MLKGISKPAIFAHRGSSAYAPENTLAAFELAVSQGADGIELDAKLTADGQVVVIHDQSVERTTNGSGHVRQMTLDDLRHLDAGGWFDERFTGEPVPTLDEVFKRFGHALIINVELTNYASPTDPLPEKVVALVEKHKLTERVFLSSFNPLALIKTHRILSQVPLGLLALRGTGGSLARSLLGNLVPHQALHPDYRDVTCKLITRTHRQGRRVHTYTVNFQADMQRMFSWNVDGIFTDDPLKAKQVRAEAPS